MYDSDSEADPLASLAEEFAVRYRRGERPALTEYTDKYPEHAERIRDLFPALVEMEQLGSVGGHVAGNFSGTSSGRGARAERDCRESGRLIGTLRFCGARRTRPARSAR